ncbi:hypothetical protein PQX77_001867 [Marasmius sp. AFHP31]|nr:hypothetical protein PQX77_001867 [Marasmius sp. AFHP31]
MEYSPIDLKGCLDVTAPKAKLHSLSLIVIGLWIAYISGLLYWLEHVVRHGPEQVDLAGSYFNGTPPLSRVQYLTTVDLPNILLTVFTQAHVPVTGMHLARIAVSAVQHRNAPRTWRELFWLADRQWLGPIGIFRTIHESRYFRGVRVSYTFFLFAITSVVALVTPLLLSQAYRVNSVLTSGTVYLNVFNAVSFNKLSAVDAPAQRNMGIRSWEGDGDFAQVIDSRIFYLPRGVSRKFSPPYFLPPGETFIAGDIVNVTVPQLRGLHLKVSCAPIDSQGLDTPGRLDTLDSWATFCKSRIPNFHGLPPAMRTDGAHPSFNLTSISIYLCNNGTTAFPFSEGPQSRNTGYAYYTGAYTRTLETGGNITQNASGLVQCNSTLTTGTVHAFGASHTFTNFTPKWLLDSSDVDETAEPLIDPLFATFNSLAQDGVDLGRTILGYGLRDSEYRGIEGHTSEADIMLSVLQSLHDGVVIFTDVLARLSRDIETYNATVSIPVALFTRDTPWAISAYALLLLWVFLVGALTAWGYRRTFSDNLDSYVAAELILRERSLLEDVPLGEVGDNEKLKEKKFSFEPWC